MNSYSRDAGKLTLLFFQFIKLNISLFFGWVIVIELFQDRFTCTSTTLLDSCSRESRYTKADTTVFLIYKIEYFPFRHWTSTFYILWFLLKFCFLSWSFDEDMCTNHPFHKFIEFKFFSLKSVCLGVVSCVCNSPFLLFIHLSFLSLHML